jgi:hypothetical protein
MNPVDPKHPWSRLVAAARRAPDERDPAAPYGFATRVAALAMTRERAVNSLLERFSLRALGIACLLAMVSVAANYSTLPGVVADQESVATDDPVAELVDLAL